MLTIQQPSATPDVMPIAETPRGVDRLAQEATSPPIACEITYAP